MDIAPGPGPWSRRRLSLTPAFIAPLRTRAVSTLQATAIVAPEVAEALPRLTSDEVVRKAVITLGALFALRPELQRNPGGPLRQIFLAKDAGMRLLQQLLVLQVPDRRRLLEAAPVSRAELARRYHVSRTHVNRLLAEAQAAGALSLVSPDRVAFSPAFSDEAEAFFAGSIQVSRVVAQMLLATR